MNIADRIDAFCARWLGAEFGPAHILLSDYNMEDDHIEFCLKCLSDTDYTNGHSQAELIATRAFLQELSGIPEDDRLEQLWAARPYMKWEDDEDGMD